MSGPAIELKGHSAEQPSPQVETQRHWDGRTTSGFGIRLMYWLFRVFGPLFAYTLLYFVVFYYLLFAGRHGRSSRNYLRRAFPQAGALKILWLNYCHFLSFGRVLLDRAYAFSGMHDRFVFERENTEAFAAGLAQGKGLIVVSAHMGNWELAAHTLATLGKNVTKVPINLVWFLNEGSDAEKHLERVRGDQPYNIIDSRDPMQASIDMVAALKRGEIVAIHGDRYTGNALRVPFFGADAPFPSGPYVVAANTGAPVVWVFANRLGSCHYSLRVIGPRALQYRSRRERNDDLRNWTAEYAAHLEARLREFPLQWHNFYEFWA
jgi:predicted LPLAT superfamily acyltransferase